MVISLCKLLLFVSALALLLFSAFASRAAAHPLGNFTINHYARLEIKPTEVQLYFVYDFAEIPTFQEKQMIDRNGDGAIAEDERSEYLAGVLDKLESNLMLDISGKSAPLALVPNSAQLQFLPGQGGLEIMELRALFTAPIDLNASPLTVRFRDDNYRERLGWREIVAKAVEGVTIAESNVRTTETSNELRNYPEDLLSNPLNDREAILNIARGVNEAFPSTSNRQISSNSALMIALLIGGVTLGVLFAFFLIVRRKPNSPR